MKSVFRPSQGNSKPLDHHVDGIDDADPAITGQPSWFYDFDGDAAGYMEGGHTSFWIVVKPDVQKTHVAFHAKDRSAVKKFYNDALKAGGKDNGKPGLRAGYSPDYFAAFVLDPNGHNIEVVCYT